MLPNNGPSIQTIPLFFILNSSRYKCWSNSSYGGCPRKTSIFHMNEIYVTLRKVR